MLAAAARPACGARIETARGFAASLYEETTRVELAIFNDPHLLVNSDNFVSICKTSFDKQHFLV